MNIFDFLEHLHSLDIQVSAENGKLRINAPKEAITPEIRAELAARKDEILLVFSALEDIPLERQNGPLPLSLVQENLWQLHRLTPNTAAYTMHAVFRICGQLDIIALDTAIQMVVDRHEFLAHHLLKVCRWVV